MRTNPIRELKDCNEFIQTIQSRTPRFVHAVVFLLVGLIAAVGSWAALTRVNLVVSAGGRVRPVSPPLKVVLARADGLSGKVAEVHFAQGQAVHTGDLLLLLDTDKLCNDIARKQRAIRAGEEELDKGDRLTDLVRRQAEATLAKLDAEITQAVEEVDKARSRQDAERKLVEAELRDAVREEESLERLTAVNAAAPTELQKAAARRRELQDRLHKINLPPDEGKVAVLRKGRQLAEEDNSVRTQEATMKRAFKKAELDAARIEVANLDLDMKQAEVRAPASGIVTSSDVHVGDVLEPGRPVVEIAEQGGYRFEFAVSSDEIEDVKPGMPVKIKLEAFDYQKYGTLDGTLDFISPDSTVIEGRPGAFYMVRVLLNGDTVSRGNGEGQVKLGMVGQVELVTGDETVLDLLFKKVRKGIRLK